MSIPRRSLMVVGNASLTAQPPCFLTAYGDSDDPLRLTVLLAEHFASLLPSVDEDARVCRSPKASWSDRHEALRRLLAQAARRNTGHMVGLADIDALKPERTDAWEDTYTFRTRSDFFSTLLEAIDRGGWVVVRPSLSRGVSAELAQLDTDVVEAEDDAGLEGLEQAVAFSPECRPVIAWLLQRQVVSPQELTEIVETVEDFEAHVLAMAYDALPASARDAAKVLSTLRPALHLNGSLGAFQFSKELSARTVPRRAVDSLRRCGFLQPVPGGGQVRMPRFIRSMLLQQGRFSMGDVLNQTHEWLASLPDDGASVEEQIEIHFHAVCAGNVERAVHTARFYGYELRELAAGLSRRHEFHKAAELFERLVTDFDAQDPYGWEYLGYNLARAYGLKERERILEAYGKAHQLTPSNPLYHGRWLGFRGELGEDISREFESGLKRYIQSFGSHEQAVAYFAEAVLKGLKRGRQDALLKRLLAKWHMTLERFAPRALKGVGADGWVEVASDA